LFRLISAVMMFQRLLFRRL